MATSERGTREAQQRLIMTHVSGQSASPSRGQTLDEVRARVALARAMVSAAEAACNEALAV